MSLTDRPDALESAERRARSLADLLWHAGTFVIITAFFWLVDVWPDGNISWAIFITVAWGLALAFHALAYWVAGRGLEDRTARRFVDEVVVDEGAAAATPISAGPQRNL